MDTGNAIAFGSPTPVRGIATDQPIELLEVAEAALTRGPVAIATLVEIRGAAARALGSQVVVTADGRFFGYVSGGCVEAAVAAEALRVIAEGRDRIVSYGKGSPFFDIVLPCGGGITLVIHLLRDGKALREVLALLHQRQMAALRYSPEHQTLVAAECPASSGWQDGDFVTVYRPPTRVLVSGETIEARTVLEIARAAGYEAVSFQEGAASIDDFTAVALLHHDLDVEEELLRITLDSPAFYVGALGSTRTHRERVSRLKRAGIADTAISRIRAPIGLFGPTKDSASLALSILADVAATRLATFN